MFSGQVHVEVANKKFTGSYKVERDVLTVENNFESESMNVHELSESAVEGAAKMLLGELVSKGKARPDRS